MDIKRALDEAAPYLELWSVSTQFPGASLYTGGILDAWPGMVVDALGICRDEQAAIQRYHAHERMRKEKPRG